MKKILLVLTALLHLEAILLLLYASEFKYQQNQCLKNCNIPFLYGVFGDIDPVDVAYYNIVFTGIITGILWNLT